MFCYIRHLVRHSFEPAGTHTYVTYVRTSTVTYVPYSVLGLGMYIRSVRYVTVRMYSFMSHVLLLPYSPNDNGVAAAGRGIA